MTRPPPSSRFDAIWEHDEEGNESWSARKLMPFLGYPRWGEFKAVVERAKIACDTSGYVSSDHFRHEPKVVQRRDEQGVTVEYVRLDRFACNHVALAGDPSKPGVADARTYFVLQVRSDEADDATMTAAWSCPATRPG